MSRKKIKKIVTRFPNLECGFFAALLAYLPAVRKHLEITNKIEWEFISTAARVVNPDSDPEIIYFNVGHSRFDQHGQPENRSLCQLCSLDLVRGEYDFLKNRPWLTEVFQLVRANDISGARISRHTFNLRELMTALSFNYPDKPELVLDWLTMAFCGIFEDCQEQTKIKSVFDPLELVRGVTNFLGYRISDPDSQDELNRASAKLAWFENLLQEARQTVSKHWAWANSAVAKAEVAGKIAKIDVPVIGQSIGVIEVICDSFKTGAAGRKGGYQIVIQWNSDGHCQIHGGCVKQYQNGVAIKKWVHMGHLAHKLRHLEAIFRGRRLKPQQNWADIGAIYFADGGMVPWYLPEFGTSVFNGTMSSRDIPETILNHSKVFELVCRELPRCDAVVEIGNNQRQIVKLV